MSIGFDNPALLPLGALIGLPLLLHLLARPRPRRLAYPSLMLLARAHRNNARIKRPHHWLLLILRTLWVAMIVGAFLQPRHFSERPPEREGRERTVIVVLDATASMRASEGAQSRYARATTEAVDVLRQLSPNDRANVIRVRALPESFYGEPGVNKTFLIDEVRRRPATLEGGEAREAVRVAASQLRDASGPREIILISDFQPGSWDPSGLALPPDTVLRLLPIAGEPLDNQAITDLRARPAAPVAGQEILIEVVAHNFSDTPVRRDLFLQVGERREQQSVDLPANGAAVVTFPMQIDADQVADRMPVHAGLSPDDFPADNTRTLVLHFRPALHAAVVGTDATARIWLRTLDALPEVRATRLDHPGSLPEDLDVLLISGWAGESLETVRAFAEAGGLLKFRPEDSGSALRNWAGHTGTVGRASRLQPAAGLQVPEPWPDVLTVFEDGRFGSPARALVHHFTPFEPDPETAQPILLLSSGQTVWARLTHLPATHLWNLSLDADHTDLSAQPEWVTLFGEWVFGGRLPGGPGPARAGDTLPTPRAALPAANVFLQDEAGDTIPHEDGDALLRATRPLPPGVYTWRDADSGVVLDMRAVNLPPGESDLRPEDPLAHSGEGGISALNRAADLQTLREGRALWPFLLLLAFLFAATEHLATLRAVRV